MAINPTTNNYFNSQPMAQNRPTPEPMQQKVMGLRRIIDIPDSKFRKNGEFPIPFTPLEVAAYEREISQKRNQLRIHDRLRAQEASYRTSDSPRVTKSVDSLSAQNVEMMYDRMVNMQNRALEKIDPEKEALVKAKFAKMIRKR